MSQCKSTSPVRADVTGHQCKARLVSRSLNGRVSVFIRNLLLPYESEKWNVSFSVRRHLGYSKLCPVSAKSGHSSNAVNTHRQSIDEKALGVASTFIA